jgi:UDP-glucuronate decarboxylase
MPTRIRHSNSRTALVAGGAGTLGTHLCERPIEQDYRVICLDNLHTGTPANLSCLRRDPRFPLIEADVCETLPQRLQVEHIYNLACPAPPPHYQTDQIHTLVTSAIGTRNLLDLAAACGAVAAAAREA